MPDVEKTPEELQAIADAKAKVAADKKAEKAALAAKNKEDKLAEKKAAKEAGDKEAADKKAAREASKQEQNGITRPLTGMTKQIWDIADRISGETKEPAGRALVIAAGKEAGLQEGTINTQYGRWRKYHGLVAIREVKPAKVPPAPTGDAEAASE